MDWQRFFYWFSDGIPSSTCGEDGGYKTLYHCMKEDWFWISITVALDLLVAIGYVIIAYRWAKQERTLKPSPERTALRSLKWIFFYCGICGYIFIPIKMFYPAWKLYDFFMLVLVFWTWKYALLSKGLGPVFAKLKRAEMLEEVSERKEDSARKSRFLSALSHDIRTPLNGVSLSAQLAVMHLKRGKLDDAQKLMQDINTQVHEATNLLTSFLEMGRLDWGNVQLNKETFSLGDFLTEIRQVFLQRAEHKGLELAISCPCKLRVKTDKIRLRRILANLVENAIKFTEKGKVEIQVTADDSAICLEVIDSGCGMSDKDFEYLFDEFYQGTNPERNRSKGFGLGLAIVQRLLTSLDGTISVQSKVNEGTSFVLSIPHIVVSDEEIEDEARREDSLGR